MSHSAKRARVNGSASRSSFSSRSSVSSPVRKGSYHATMYEYDDSDLPSINRWYDDDDDDEDDSSFSSSDATPPEEDDQEGEYAEVSRRSMSPILTRSRAAASVLDENSRYTIELRDDDFMQLETALPFQTSEQYDDDDDSDAVYRSQKLWYPRDDEEEEEDDDDDEYRAEDDEDDDDDISMDLGPNPDLEQELEDLKNGNRAPTLCQPEDIRRIRKALRDHVQLLTEVMMLSASLGKYTQEQHCAGMLENIYDLGTQTNLDSAIMLGAKPDDIRQMLDAYKEEKQKTPLVPDQSTWMQPIAPRFDRILRQFAPTLEFDAALFPEIKRQKVRHRPKKNDESASPAAEPAPASIKWRNWHESELDLVVLGLERFGANGRGVPIKINQHLLPCRDPHVITRIIYEAKFKKRAEKRFESIRKSGFTSEVRLKPDEETRLLHGVAEQQVKQIDKVDFAKISQKYLPHRSDTLLKKCFEDMLIRDAAAATTPAHMYKKHSS